MVCRVSQMLHLYWEDCPPTEGEQSTSNDREQVRGGNIFVGMDLAYRASVAYIYEICINNCWKYLIHKNAYFVVYFNFY